MSRTSTETETVSLQPLHPHPLHSSPLPSYQPRPQSALFEQTAPGIGVTLTPTLSNAAPSERTSYPVLSSLRTVSIVITVATATLIQSMLSGVLTIGLPRIAEDLGISESLLLWPASVSALVSGCTLLLCGSISDVVGSRSMYLLGCLLLALFTLACGFSQNGTQLIVFRAITGLSLAMCLPTAVSITTASFPPGRVRNLAFAVLGAAQPIGFAIGLVLGGILVDGIGWRYAYWIAPIIPAIAIAMALVSLRSDAMRGGKAILQALAIEVDWVGALMAGAAMGLLSYVFAVVTTSTTSIKSPLNIVILVVAVACLPGFVFWEAYREKKSRSAMIPNSLWRNVHFSCICAAVFFGWAAFSANQYFLTLYFQKVQQISATQASLRFLPMVFSGAATNLGTGFVVHRVRADHLVVGTVLLTLASPIIMALADRNASYWTFSFPAVLLAPICADTLFTISNLVITSVFPSKTHGLAGAVFNALAQISTSVGLAVAALVSNGVSGGNLDVDGLEKGYRAAFWTVAAAQAAMLLITAVGLRGVGKVGLKRD